MSSFALDHLVPEDGLEFANAFTLLGQPRLNMMVPTLDLALRHIGDVLGCADGSLAAQHI